MSFNIKSYSFLTPDIGVSISGPSFIRPNTSEQLRISGNNSPLGISKKLK